jgi:hypothetical protein
VEAGDSLAWEKLRGTRWSPPPAASGDLARRRTYVFALEQASRCSVPRARSEWRRGRLPDELVARPPMLGHDLPQPRGVGLVHWLDDLFPLLQVIRGLAAPGQPTITSAWSPSADSSIRNRTSRPRPSTQNRSEARR